MNTKLSAIALTTKIEDHPAIEGMDGVSFVPKTLTVTQYPGDRLTNGPFVSIKGTRVLKSGQVGRANYYLGVHFSGRRLYSEIGVDGLRERSPELAAEVERQVAMIEGLS